MAHSRVSLVFERYQRCLPAIDTGLSFFCSVSSPLVVNKDTPLFSQCCGRHTCSILAYHYGKLVFALSPSGWTYDATICNVGQANRKENGSAHVGIPDGIPNQEPLNVKGIFDQVLGDSSSPHGPY